MFLLKPWQIKQYNYLCFFCRKAKAHIIGQRYEARHPNRPRRDKPEYGKRYRATEQGRTKASARMQIYYHDPRLHLRHLARSQARRAVAAGLLSRQACGMCGSEKAQIHHEDYTKPLDIQWLCRPCHQAHHHQTAQADREMGAGSPQAEK